MAAAVTTAAVTTAAVTTAAVTTAGDSRAADQPAETYVAKNGRIRQSACHWNFNRGEALSGEALAQACVKMGVGSVELVGPEHWPTLRKHGLTCAIAGSHGFAKGFAHVEEHEECWSKLRQSIDASAAFGVKNVITFSGFRRGLIDEDARRNMIAGLKKILPYAEERKVQLCLEMLNSRVGEEMKGHPDYWCDRMDMALDICRSIGSPSMKILFDLYHVQIMDGDVIRRLQQCREYVGHVHTAGNPGRGDLDGAMQEMNYPALMRAVADIGYQGFVGQEFIPQAADVAGKLRALNVAVKMCDI